MPLETAIPPLDLHVLEDLIQQRLHDHLPEISPLQASCTLKQQTLLMVVQHPAPLLAHPMRIFRLLEVIFREQKLEQKFRGLMYLQAQGQQQPYAFHSFTPIALVDDVAAQVYATTPAGLQERGESSTATPSVLPEAVVSMPPSPPPPPPSIHPSEVEIDEQLEPVQDQAVAPDLPEFMVTEPTGDTFVRNPEEEERWVQWAERLWMPIIAVASVLGAGIFFGSLYMMSRPCVLLGCQTLTIAQEMADRSVVTLRNPGSGKQMLQAQAQLNQSIELLERIPKWSRRYDDAQILITNYEATAVKVVELVTALQAANQAANLTQAPPLPLETWQAAVEQWETAIADLEAVPPTSGFHGFARKKVREYKANLEIVAQQRDREREALENLAAAQEAAKIAAVRQNIAQSAADLQLAHSTWQTAVNALQAIPSNSVVAAEAQRLLKDYQPKAQLARDRQTFENFASDTFAQAQRSAQQAKIAQQQNQWSQAVGHWNKALSALKQISKSSFNYPKAQPLLQDYQAALSRAESRRSGALQLQAARNELEKLCKSETPRICTFTINREKITVYLNEAYLQRVRENHFTAETQGNIKAQVDIREHIAVLEQSLEKISDQVGARLEIYSNDNILVKSHTP
ncbi:MAG: hypothetical protein F6J87_26320 [Spirulina sp. SIO3F2]|nr:hypothetical protein [Spirulina sp. SIO3F2]